ncbi:MAG: hypothetical protein GX591_20500 [Planctomycetes bacterium]|nr:hypothetical protein [Planctomycetota bacterium]
MATETFPEGSSDDVTDVHIDDYALTEIDFRLRRLGRQFGLSDHDLEDIRQDMVIELWSAQKRFNPRKARRRTFISRVLDRFVLYLTRQLCTRQRRPAENAVSFDDLDSRFEPRVNNTNPGELDEQALRELQLDVATLIDRLPADLQPVCRVLMHTPGRAAARELGIGKSTLYRAIAEIRTHFTAMGYCGFPVDAWDTLPPAADVEGAPQRKEGAPVTDGEILIDLSVLKIESAYDYHAKAAKYLSSHQLMDFIKCPWLFFKKHSGLIEGGDTAAYLIGRAAHCRILEGRDVYEASYALGGPINPSTGRSFGSNTKAFREWAEATGRPVLSHEQVELIENMVSGVMMNAEAARLLRRGRAEGVVRATYCDTPCQIRIDWTHPRRGIVDLKTCDDLTWFEADAKRYGYANQVAFYQSVLAEVTGRHVPVHIIAIEKREPFRCGVWRVSDDTLTSFRRINEAAIGRLLACRGQNDWPTDYEIIRLLDIT